MASLLIQDKGSIRLLTLNRPERMNAMDAPLRFDIINALRDASNDHEVRAVIFTGAGDRAFCAGQDLHETATLGDAAEGDWIATWGVFFQAFLDCEKPLVASINGVTAGGGLEIVMLCDIRVAAPDAKLIMAEIDVGLPTIMGAFLLRNHVMDSHMMNTVLSGRRILADEAKRMGLIHQIVEREDLAQATLAIARDLASKPPVAMQANVRRFRHLLRQRFETDSVRTALARYHDEAVASGEPQRAMNRFLSARRQRKK